LNPKPLSRPLDPEEEEEKEEGSDPEEEEQQEESLYPQEDRPTLSEPLLSSSYPVGQRESGRWGRGVATEVADKRWEGGREQWQSQSKFGCACLVGV
jgi:hypothetical protein